MFVKALLLGNYAHQSACELSPGLLSYFRTSPRLPCPGIVNAPLLGTVFLFFFFPFFGGTVFHFCLAQG